MSIVYMTTNTINGNIYVGVHNGKQKSYLGSGPNLQRSIKKYGSDKFIRETLFEGTPEECLEIEALIVDEEFISRRDTYNITVGGGMPPGCYGNQHAVGMTYEHSESAKKAIGEFQKSRKRSTKEIALFKKNRKGKGTGERNAMASAENRAKVAASKIGRKRVYQPDGTFKYLFPEDIK